MQATCSRILIISGGKLVADGTPDALRARETRRPLPGGGRVERRRPRRRSATGWPAWPASPAARWSPARTGSHAFAIDAAAADDLRKPIFRAAVDNRWTLLELARESASLEDVFRNLTTGDEEAQVMSPALVISRREIRTYFNSPVAYIVVTVFTIITGYLFFTQLFLEKQADMRGFFGIMPLLFMFLVPAITMRLLAEEKSQRHAGAAHHDAGARLGGGGRQVPGGDGAAVHGARA